MSMVSVKHAVLYVLLILVICVVGFRGLPTQPWTYDDLDHVEAAQKAQADGALLFSAEAKEPTRWVLNVYFYFAYKLFGESPAFYHTINIPLHAVNALLCAYLILVLFGRPLLAGVSGILFVLHCAGYEAVYEVSAVGVLIGTAWALCSVLMVLRYLSSANLLDLFLAVGAYFFAILSYESFASVLIPMLYLWWHHTSRDFRVAIALCVPVGVFVVIDTLFYNTGSDKVAFNAMVLGEHAVYNLGFFVGRLFLNAYLTPFGWDGPPPFDVGLDCFDVYAIVGGVCIAGLLFLSRKNDLVRFGTVWVIATLLPYLFGVQQFYFSRYWYLACVGSALLLAWCLVGLTDRFPGQLKYGVLALCLVIVLGASFHKMHRFEGRFLTHAGNFYLDHRQDADTAIRLYERARDEYDIHMPMLYNNLSAAFIEVERLDDALVVLSRLLKDRPDYANGYRQLGAVRAKQGDVQAALQAYIKAGELSPENLDDLHRFADQLFLKQNYAVALTAYQYILQIAPEYPHRHLCFYSMARISYALSDLAQARVLLQQALDVVPSFQPARNFLTQIQ